MNQPVQITNGEWADTNKKIDMHEQDIDYLKKRTERHSDRLDRIEDQYIALPQAIQEAVTTGMAPVMEKLLKHDERLAQMDLEKVKEEKARFERQVEEDKERRRWLIRSIVGAVIGATVGPAITLIIFILVNNA